MGVFSYMSINLLQGVSDAVYSDFVERKRFILFIQRNEYYMSRLKSKKYLWLQNEEVPEKPDIRFMIESVEEGYGGVYEDIYGQYIAEPHIKVTLRKRDKTR